MPPPQMVANMKVGTMDAFCVGEPWNDQLVNQKIGYTACLTGELWRDHPEKSLGMRADWVEKYPNAAVALTAAVIEAATLVRRDGQQGRRCAPSSAGAPGSTCPSPTSCSAASATSTTATAARSRARRC